MNEMKITLITFVICTVIIFGAIVMVGSEGMINFLAGVLLYLVMKREVKDWDDSGRL